MSKGRSFFSIRWGVEYPADPAFLGMIEEKVDATLRRLNTNPFDMEEIMVSVLGVCEEMIVVLLDEDGESLFRVDMTVLAERLMFTIRCTPHELPDGCAIGTFLLQDQTARSLEMESLNVANENMDDVEGEINEDGTFTIILSRALTKDQRRDPPMFG
ncbi:MAG TPA: hypothetical protein ENH10_00810 [Bacteroidetes bacterium]|nr:hypothetical protein BMS3Bbin04_01081 [bacterium BMS3Bbin04]HDO64559.1 hypothetical protein [Bacteroidota bacterium]HEX03684.1 hypothetical protein [Bacteroidota bacterium]